MRIRKFNEDNENNELDIVYIEECLVEIYDKYHAYPIESDIDDLLFQVEIDFGVENYSDYGHNEDTIRYINTVFTDLIELSTEAMEKVKIKYNNIRPFYDLTKDEGLNDVYVFTISVK